MTQKQRILEHMQRYGGITPKEAENKYGIMRLGARIYELKAGGHRIDKTWEISPNRYGEMTRYARYVLRMNSEEIHG